MLDNDVAATQATDVAPPDHPQEKKSKAKKAASPDLKTVEECVEQYNEMILTAVDLNIKGVGKVTAFDSPEAGKKAIDSLQRQIDKKRKGDKGEPSVRKTSKARYTGKKKVVAKKSSSMSNGKSPRGPRVKFEEDAKITWTGKENPCRVKDSPKWARWEIVRKHDGKTVKTFLANDGNPTTLKNAVAQKHAKVG